MKRINYTKQIMKGLLHFTNSLELFHQLQAQHDFEMYRPLVHVCDVIVRCIIATAIAG